MLKVKDESYLLTKDKNLSLKEVKKSAGGYNVTVQNIGGFAAPVDLLIKYTDGTEEKKHLSPSVWEKDQKQTTVTVTTKKSIQSAQLAGGIFMDADVTNNTVKSPDEKKGF